MIPQVPAVGEFTSGKIRQLAVEKANLVDKEDPFFVCDLDDVASKFSRWCRNFPRIRPFYAVKCNEDSSVLKLLARLGAGFDCASKHEIDRVLTLTGVEPDSIVFANPCKQKSHVTFAKERGVSMITFDNEAELHKLSRLFPRAELILRILVDDSASQCQLGQKYGAHPVREAVPLLHVAKRLGLHVVGVSFHVGSGCSDATAFAAAIRSARTVVDAARGLGFAPRLLDIGGGFPGNETVSPSFEEIADVVNEALEDNFPQGEGIDIIAEPGRYFVASAFTLCVNVIAKREDATSRMFYVNDGVYGSFNCLLYDHAMVRPEPLVPTDGAPLVSSLWGPTCDGLDCIADRCYLPEGLDVGDWLMFANMGAYTISAGSSFNGFPRPVGFYFTAQSGKVVRSGEGLAVSGEGLAVSGGDLSVSGEGLAVSGDGLSVSGGGLSVSGEGLSVSGEDLGVSGESENQTGDELPSSLADSSDLDSRPDDLPDLCDGYFSPFDKIPVYA